MFIETKKFLNSFSPELLSITIVPFDLKITNSFISKYSNSNLFVND